MSSLKNATVVIYNYIYCILSTDYNEWFRAFYVEGIGSWGGVWLVYLYRLEQPSNAICMYLIIQELNFASRLSQHLECGNEIHSETDSTVKMY